MSKFLDFNKDEKEFYDNLYLDDFKIVVKMPLKKNESLEVKIEKFDLSKYLYILSY